MSPVAQFSLARQLRSPEGTSLGEVFSFVSGLYFRGKLAYARRFARPPDPANPVAAGGILVITPNAGLRSPDTPITLASLEAFAAVSIDLANGAYRQPLETHVRLTSAIGAELGSALFRAILDERVSRAEARAIFLRPLHQGDAAAALYFATRRRLLDPPLAAAGS